MHAYIMIVCLYLCLNVGSKHATKHCTCHRHCWRPDAIGTSPQQAAAAVELSGNHVTMISLLEPGSAFKLRPLMKLHRACLSKVR